MEELILKIIENSLVGGAFLFLLYHFVTKFTSTQQDIVTALSEITNTLTLLSERITKLEGRDE